MEPATTQRRFSPEIERKVSELMATGRYPTVEELLLEALHALDYIRTQREEQAETFQHETDDIAEQTK